MTISTQVDVVIVGAGMAGIMAAHRLHEEGLHVCLLEKERQAGGRLDAAEGNRRIVDAAAGAELGEPDDRVRLVDEGVRSPDAACCRTDLRGRRQELARRDLLAGRPTTSRPHEGIVEC